MTKFNIALLTLIFAMSACNESTNIVNESIAVESSNIIVSKTQFESSGFKLGTIEKKQFDKAISCYGDIYLPNKNKTIVSSLMSGTVGKFNLMEGQKVKKGQVLFTVSNPELITMQEAFLIHNSELSYLEEESKRLHNLYEENIVTKKEVLSADAALRTAKAKFQAVKKKLTLYGINTNNISSENFVTRLPILAPQSGNLKEINVVRGDYLDQSTPAMLIEATTNLFAEFNVFEKDVPFIKKGQKIIFTSQTNPETMYHSEITLINQSLGENGMISILSEVTDKQTTDLLPGMKIKGNIKIESMISHALPEDAFVKIGDKSFILKLISENEENYSFEKIMLPTGELQDNYLQITKFEENSNEKYLVKGAYFLIN